ncbi:MAG TPA: hypothetical protein VFA75_04760 [Nevskia sp.]|nr:hypothetical protein [Nevskia sp.]
MIKHDVQSVFLQAGASPTPATLSVAGLSYPPAPAHAGQHIAATPRAHAPPPQAAAAVSSLFLIAALFAAAAELVYRIAPRRRSAAHARRPEAGGGSASSYAGSRAHSVQSRF